MVMYVLKITHTNGFLVATEEWKIWMQNTVFVIHTGLLGHTGRGYIFIWII
jgi:hypothetical protein